ncbi:MAG TPA: energy-coupled thiamine transporter ThiT, partial [Candidatus Avilachnospira avistercoris]|nr:energy-coupled thiamine transporter ThiT [Candidatus Avilachnospira avistercoris]
AAVKAVCLGGLRRPPGGCEDLAVLVSAHALGVNAEPVACDGGSFVRYLHPAGLHNAGVVKAVSGVAYLLLNIILGVLGANHLAALGRYVMATIAGLIWYSLGSVIWEGWSPLPYSLAYNIIYIGPEMLMTVIIISIPAVKNALKRIKKEANS